MTKSGVVKVFKVRPLEEWDILLLHQTIDPPPVRTLTPPVGSGGQGPQGTAAKLPSWGEFNPKHSSVPNSFARFSFALDFSICDF